MAEELTAFERSLHESSELVKEWGARSPAGKVSVRQLMTVDGLSLWDVMSAELALYHVPHALAEQPERRTLRQILKHYLRPLKYAIWRGAPVNTDDCARWPSGPTALCIGFSPYLARDVLQPVVDMLLRERGLTPVFLSEDPASADDPASPRHSVHRHRGTETVNEARRFAKAARRVSSVLAGSASYKSIFVRKGRPLWPLIKDGVRKAFDVHASFLLPDTIAVARHVLSIHKPAAIVSIDVADPRTRVYSLLGAQLGIPTVQIQSGGFGQEAVEWRFLLDDFVAVQGEYSREVFVSHGIAAKQLVLTGSPRYDRLANASASEVSELRERFGIPQENRIIVFASSYFLEVHENSIAESGRLLRSMKKAIFAAVAATPGVWLIVKPHPLENVVETQSLVADHSRVTFAQRTDDIRILTRACDAFLSMGSSVTMDALILGKPTICPAFPGWHFSNLFIRPGAVMAPQTEGEILAAIREIAADGGAEIFRRHEAQRDRYLAAVVHGAGRGATRRIIDLLKAIIQPVATAANSATFKGQQ